jgi:hypothetical protein
VSLSTMFSNTFHTFSFTGHFCYWFLFLLTLCAL